MSRARLTIYWRYTKSTAILTLVFVMFTPATTPCGDRQSPLLHLPQCLLCSLQPPLPDTKSTATLTLVFVMFTPATTPCEDIQSPLLHLPQCLLCSLPVESYKVHCYTYLCVCYVHSSHHSLWRYTKSTAIHLSVCYVHSSHHSLWRHTKSTATLTSVFVMFTPATTPCGDIQSPLLHLP